MYPRHKTHGHSTRSCNIPLTWSSRSTYPATTPYITTRPRSSQFTWSHTTRDPLARLMVMGHTPQQHRNLIRDTIVSLAQYGLHFQDTDEPVITNILQLLLREHPGYILLEQPHSNKYTDPNIPFTIVGNRLEHIPYTHNHDMHQWLKGSS